MQLTCLVGRLTARQGCFQRRKRSNKRREWTQTSPPADGRTSSFCGHQGRYLLYPSIRDRFPIVKVCDHRPEMFPLRAGGGGAAVGDLLRRLVFLNGQQRQCVCTTCVRMYCTREDDAFCGRRWCGLLRSFWRACGDCMFSFRRLTGCLHRICKGLLANRVAYSG